MKLIKKNIQYISFFAALVFALFSSVSCTNSKPEITFGFLQLVLYQTDDGPREQFSFFIIPEDEDGLENLDELYLYHDREQLRWQIKSDEWVTYTQGERTWIGTRSIAVTDGSGLPRGLYRAVLFNKGGESAERTFTFDSAVRYPFPELEVTDGKYTVKSNWPVNRLVCYDRSGNYIATVKLSSLTGEVSALNLSSNARTAALWAEDEDNNISAFTNVVSVR
ncbi:MAG: hypothetical protein LBQ89_05140 [Treponema sp.]|nr:hypothetical protein [Treponema sp.]